MTTEDASGHIQVSTRGGPWLQLAVFCERVLVEKDDVTSAMRIVDRWTIRGGPDSPQEMPATNVTLWMYIAFKSGAARGMSQIRIVGEDPAGQRMPELGIPMLFEGEDRGHGIVAPSTFQFTMQGLFWFSIFVDDNLMTRMPLRITYERVNLESQARGG